MELINNNKHKKKRYEIAKNYKDLSLETSVRQSNEKIKQILEFGYRKQQWKAQQQRKQLSKKSERISLPKLLTPFSEQKQQNKQQNNVVNLQRQKPNYKLEQLKRHKNNKSVFSLDFNRAGSNIAYQSSQYDKNVQSNSQKMKRYSRQLKMQHLSKFREKQQIKLNKSLCQILSEQNNCSSFNDLEVHQSLLKMQSRNDSIIKMENNAKKCQQIYQKRIKSQNKNERQLYKKQISKSEKLLKQYSSQISGKISEKYHKNRYRHILNNGEFSYLLNFLKQKSQQRQIIERERLLRMNGKNSKNFMRYQEIQKQYYKNKSLQKQVVFGVETNIVSVKKKLSQPKKLKNIQNEPKNKLSINNCSLQVSQCQSKKPSMNSIQVVGKGKDREIFKKYLIILDKKKYKANKNHIVNQSRNKSKVNTEETKKMLQTGLLCSPWEEPQHQQQLVILDQSFEQNQQKNEPYNHQI